MVQGGDKKKYWRTTNKFCIEVPKILENYLEISFKMRTDYCYNTIFKEMTNFIFALYNLGGMNRSICKLVRSNLGINISQLTWFFILKWKISSQWRFDWLPTVTINMHLPLSDIQVWYQGKELWLPLLFNNWINLIYVFKNLGPPTLMRYLGRSYGRYRGQSLVHWIGYQSR